MIDLVAKTQQNQRGAQEFAEVQLRIERGL
jgi:hypothetical protein